MNVCTWGRGPIYTALVVTLKLLYKKLRFVFSSKCVDKLTVRKLTEKYFGGDPLMQSIEHSSLSKALGQFPSSSDSIHQPQQTTQYSI